MYYYYIYANRGFSSVSFYMSLIVYPIYQNFSHLSSLNIRCSIKLNLFYNFVPIFNAK